MCAWKMAINRLETCQFLIHDVSWHGFSLIKYLIIGLTLKQMAGSSNGSLDCLSLHLTEKVIQDATQALI